MKIDINNINIPLAILDNSGNIIKSNFSFNAFFNGNNIFDIINPSFQSIIKTVLDNNSTLYISEKKNKKILNSDNYFTINLHQINNEKYILELYPKTKEYFSEINVNTKLKYLYSILDFYYNSFSFLLSLQYLSKEELIDNMLDLIKNSGFVSSISTEEFGNYYVEFYDKIYYYELNNDIPLNLIPYINNSIDVLSKYIEKTYDYVSKKDGSNVFEYLEIANNLIVGMFHEINNPLSIVLMKAEMLDNLIEEKYKPYLNSIVENIYRIIEITGLFRSLVKGEKSQSKIDLIETINDVVRFMRHKAPSNIKIDFNHSNTPCYIMGNKQELMIVFSNLIENAIEAIGENYNGLVNISEFSKLYTVTVEDNGEGIPKENIKRIFEPFFTTKSKHGMGYGLFFVYNICLKHKIEINVESEVNKGTKFILKIPKIREE
jgi:signal transduction histidine kinase